MRVPSLPLLSHRAFVGLRRLLAVAIATLMLTGCMQYDVSVNFHTPQSGEFVQSIQLSERLTALGNRSTQDWLHSLEERARSVHGRVKHLNRQDLEITVPFSTAQDFVEKFNQWFNPDPVSSKPVPAKPGSAKPGSVKPVSAKPISSKPVPSNPVSSELIAQSPPPSSALRPPSSALRPPSSTLYPPSSLISTQLTLKQANYLLAVRHVLDLEVDLRSLGVSSDSGQVLVVPGSLFDLNFQVTAPGGVRNLNPAENHGTPTPLGQTWRLQPGQVNHITAAFWVANPLGWGALMIAGLVALGTLAQPLIHPLIQARRRTV